MANLIPNTVESFTKDKFAQLKGHPCRLVSAYKSDAGKHGNEKYTLTGISLLDGAKYEDVFPAGSQVLEPTFVVVEWEAEIVADDGTLTLVRSATGDQREDLKIPADRLEEAQKARKDDKLVLVTVWTVPVGDNKDSMTTQDIVNRVSMPEW
jgi:translation elongation factor P/translation initiation factor 5A